MKAKHVLKKHVQGSILCTLSTFGSDPAVGVDKDCLCSTKSDEAASALKGEGMTNKQLYAKCVTTTKKTSKCMTAIQVKAVCLYFVK